MLKLLSALFKDTPPQAEVIQSYDGYYVRSSKQHTRRLYMASGRWLEWRYGCNEWWETHHFKTKEEAVEAAKKYEIGLVRQWERDRDSAKRDKDRKNYVEKKVWR